MFCKKKRKLELQPHIMVSSGLNFRGAPRVFSGLVASLLDDCWYNSDEDTTL